MPKPMITNWKVVSALLLMGALPALPASFLVSLIIAGEPHEFVRPIYLAHPLPIEIHAFAGIVFWLLMPLQFSPRIRQRWPQWHRLAGRTAVMAAVVLGASSIWLVVMNPPIGGAVRSANLFVNGAGTMFAFGYALWFARQRKITQHKAWMMRAVGVTYGAATTAIIAIPVFLTFGEYGGIASELDRWAGLLVNVLFVEWLIRRKVRPRHQQHKNVYIGIQ